MKIPRGIRYAVVAVAAGLSAWWLVSPGGSSDQGDTVWAEVRQGPLEVTITGAGRVRAQEAVVITVPDDVSGELQIIYLVSEGTRVERGQMLAQLDTTAAVQRLESALDQLETGEQEYQQLLEDHENALRNVENQVRSAELSYQQAELQLRNLEFSAELQRQQGELNLEKARISKTEAERRLAATKIIQEAERVQRRIELEGRRLEVRRAEQEIRALTLLAPSPGMVIHAEQGRFMERTKVREGDTVRRRQSLVELPDLTRLQVQVTINELDAEWLRTGQQARIRLEAYPREVFSGQVTEYSTLAQETTDEGNVKVFPAVVTLDEADPRIRPGMSASAEIVVDVIPEAIRVPLAAVCIASGTTFVRRIGTPDPVPIVLGVRNESEGQVLSGLAPGDRVELDWMREPGSALGLLAGRVDVPEQVARAILAQGDQYGAASLPADQTMAQPGAAGGRRGQGGRGIDLSQLPPEIQRMVEQSRQQAGDGRLPGGLPEGFDPAIMRRAAGGADTTRAASIGGLNERLMELRSIFPDSVQQTIDRYLEQGGNDRSLLHPSVLDSVRARGGMRAGARTIPPVPPENGR